MDKQQMHDQRDHAFAHDSEHKYLRLYVKLK